MDKKTLREITNTPQRKKHYNMAIEKGYVTDELEVAHIDVIDYPSDDEIIIDDIL